MRSAIGIWVLSITLLAVPLSAQNARVSGRVVDAQQAVVKGSEVTLVNIGTKGEVRTLSNEDGNFILPPVPPGLYEITAGAAREIDMVLTAIERAQARNPRPDPRHRIEHASVMNQALLDRARKAGVILVFHSYMWEHGDKLASFGEKRLSMMHAYRTAIDMGIHVAGHSDSTVSAADPLLRIQDMVTRQGSDGKVYGGNQRVSVEEAIDTWTMGGAYATFEENLKGSITAGKLADFVVLRQDPRRTQPTKIKDIVIDATWVGGKIVFSASTQVKAMLHPFEDWLIGDGEETENLAHDHE